MNLIIGIIALFSCFTVVVILDKKYPKYGLTVWISIATLIANIAVCKQIKILGYMSALGNILFASVFLASDILTEKYGKQFSNRAINLSVIMTIVFMISTQIILLFKPENSQIQEAMTILFNFNFRVSLSSLLMYFLSSKADIFVYSKIKQLVPDKLWLRNNLSTILCNCLENFGFSFMAFLFVLPVKDILIICITSSVIETIIAIADTPFMYLAKKVDSNG